MKDKDKILSEIFNNDPLGLLNVNAKNLNQLTSSERLVAKFEEINDFIDTNNREPESSINNISEYKLFSTLKGHY